MEESFIELIEGPDSNLTINEYHPDYTILKERSEKSSSGVWKHFGMLKHNDAVDRKHVYCIKCFFNQKIKKYQRSTSTGNLSKHLKKHHNISLNQTFRVKKESNNSIVIVHKEEDFENEEYNANNASNAESGDEFLVHDINEILIAEVAKRPLLYKSQACQQEKGIKHQIRRQLWTEIYDSLNHLIPLQRLPKIWKNIRDRYHKVRRCVENIQENDTNAIRPKYRYYEMLHFLDPTSDEQKSFDLHKSLSPRLLEHTEEEADVDEFLITGDHDHYISTEAIVLPNEGITYEEVTYEPRAKKLRTCPKKPKVTKTTYQSINNQLTPNLEREKNRSRKSVTNSSKNIIEEPFVNATTATTMPSNNEIFKTFEDEELIETELIDIRDNDQNNHEEITMDQLKEEMITTTVPKAPNTGNATPDTSLTSKKSDEFEIFGNFLAEIMRNMSRTKSRKLQMDVLKLVRDAEDDSQ